ncbi:hypothetical protein ACWPM1_09750 [Tsuneonella sp. HG249]
MVERPQFIRAAPSAFATAMRGNRACWKHDDSRNDHHEAHRRGTDQERRVQVLVVLEVHDVQRPQEIEHPPKRRSPGRQHAGILRNIKRAVRVVVEFNPPCRQGGPVFGVFPGQQVCEVPQAHHGYRIGILSGNIDGRPLSPRTPTPKERRDRDVSAVAIVRERSGHHPFRSHQAHERLRCTKVANY